MYFYVQLVMQIIGFTFLQMAADIVVTCKFFIMLKLPISNLSDTFEWSQNKVKGHGKSFKQYHLSEGTEAISRS